MNYRSELENDPFEQSYYTISARKVREELESILRNIYSSKNFQDRSDKKWVIASLVNVLIGLKKFQEAQDFENIFTSFQQQGDLAVWEIETFNAGKSEVSKFVK